MGEYRVLEVKQSVFASNEKEADKLRADMKEKGTLLINLMSSPGSGKTTTLLRTIDALKNRLSIAVMQATLTSSSLKTLVIWCVPRNLTREQASTSPYFQCPKATISP